MLGRRNSIRTLLSALLVTLILPLVGLLAFAEYRSYTGNLNRARDGLMSTADAASMGIRQFLNESERILGELSRNPDVRALDPGRCPPAFQVLGDLFIPRYTNIFTWTVDMRRICWARPELPEDEPLGSPPGLDEILASEGFTITPVHEGTSTGIWTTGLSYPLRNGAGEKTGFVTVSVDLIQFQEILEDLEPPGDGVISVWDTNDWTVVARSRNADRWVGRAQPMPNAWQPDDPASEARGFSEARNLEGEFFLWGFTRVPGTSWVVFAGRPAAAVQAGIVRQAVLSSILTLLLLGVTFLLGLRVYRTITRPLNQLVSETGQALPGETSPLTVGGPEEIALVARRFNEAWNAREEAERERMRSDERYRSLVENAVTPIYVSTEEGQFLQVNQAMVDLLGYESREELLATAVSDLYASHEDRLATLEEHGSKDVFKGVQVEWQRKDGEHRTVRLLGRRLVTRDGETAWEVIAEDVTELTNLQAQYLQAQKMEALGRMAGGIAHDFNNLLTVVQGRADLILADPRVGEDLKAQIREISEAARRGGALNRELLAFGRRTAVEEAALDLNRIIREFETILRRAVGEEVRVRINLTPDPATIRGARSQVEQVIMNLVVNSRDAMPRGGDLLVETYHADVSKEDTAAYPEAAPGYHVVLAVSDTGTGIDPEVLPNIFEPFFSTKDEMEGTGLGLSTVYGIVVEAGGHLRVESSPDEGTTFRAFFPAEDLGQDEVHAPRAEALPQGGSGVILLAEDQEAVAKLTTQILEAAGYEVIAAADGTEALARARERDGTIHLLLSDIVMPGLRGPELAETLVGEEIIDRAVFFSGYAEGMKDDSLTGLQAWELIPKPFKAAQLLKAIERVLKA